MPFLLPTPVSRTWLHLTQPKCRLGTSAPEAEEAEVDEEDFDDTENGDEDEDDEELLKLERGEK